jgi:hypothetical protein
VRLIAIKDLMAFNQHIFVQKWWLHRLCPSIPSVSGFYWKLSQKVHVSMVNYQKPNATNAKTISKHVSKMHSSTGRRSSTATPTCVRLWRELNTSQLNPHLDVLW